jgi:ribosomal protein L31E
MTEHQDNTGKVNKVKLESSIDRLIWSSGIGIAGAKVGVEVNTHFAGNNSVIKIEISDKSGKVFETVKSKISGNFFWTQITIPEKPKMNFMRKLNCPSTDLAKN